MKKIKNKQKTRKAVAKRIKVTGTGKLMRSHQLRTAHLKRSKSKRTLRRHARVVEVHKSSTRLLKRMMGLG